MNTRSIAYAVSASVIAIALMGCEGGRDSENQAVAEEPASRGAARSASALSAERIETPEQLDQLVEQIKELPADEQRRALSALQFSPFIVGGEEVPIANHPWQVALLRGQQTDRSQFCGGSLVAPDTVVTAAHCIDSWFVQKDPARVDVLIGTANTQQGGERIKVRSVALHPSWNSRNNDYDVAVLRLATPATQGRAVPIHTDVVATLPKTGTWVTGWGAIGEGRPGSDLLLGVEVPVVANTECNKPESYGGRVTAQMLCAGERAGGKDSCQGDSGGPLTHNQRLIGIVSWGAGCARELKYGVYTRVSSVAPWIRSQMGS